MRQKLKEMVEIKGVFTADYVKTFSSKRGRKGTVLLLNVKNEDDLLLTDHIWIYSNPELTELNLVEGERIIFRAKVVKYTKGQLNDKQEDYKLTNISCVKRYFVGDVSVPKRKRRGKRGKKGITLLEEDTEGHVA
ncbi:hypothetical protein ACP26L_06750 [Paenibacillus sp. S-38]|uniref:hypothetical protein n=1 Tax=Paenibacillus sp. S-38 TaxID=3416710 RepID=UPI003CE7FA0A